MLRALADADIVVYLIDATREPGPEEEALVKALAASNMPLVAIVNKVDHAEAIPERAIAFVAEHLPGVSTLRISAKEKLGLDELVDYLLDKAEDGPTWYPEEYYTDQEPVFRIAEIIREKIILHTREELPHAVFVDFTDSRKLEEGGLEVNYDIVVERESQKGIVIGKAGSMIKQIREEAEADLAEIFDYPVRLRLQVRVDSSWKHDDKRLDSLIF